MGRVLRGSRAGFTLVELMVVVAILGILAIMAVPAFLRYMKRAKTAEAIDELDKVCKGAAFYYTQPHANVGGSRLSCQFPVGTNLTPGSDCCSSTSDTDGDQRCDANAALWDAQGWTALAFQMGDQHYFQYQWANNGAVLSSATATASAHADLDCNAVYTTFQRMVFGDPNASQIASECSIIGSSAFFIVNETE